ncbi:hypothetical protein E2I00_017396, partial [Balaenoptera physalus]
LETRSRIMSSPLASLGKTRRVPLHSEPVNPGPVLMLLPCLLQAQTFASQPPFSPQRGAGIGHPGPPREPVFYPHMLGGTENRLPHLDQGPGPPFRLGFSPRADRKIRALEELVETLQEHQGTVTLQRQKELETMCAQLQRQRFLGDYGLQWVGEPMAEEDSEDGERDWMTAKKFWKPGDSLVPPQVDFDRLLASLKDLSELAVDSDTQLTPVPSRVPHCVLEPIPLKLYRNGIVMFDGPFRPFHDPSTQRCLRDILDGFFPSELQRLYPDGVPFKVSDLRNQVYPENGLDAFPGESRVVGWQRIRKPLDRMEHPEYPLPLWLTGLIHPWSGEVPCRGWGEGVTGRAQGSVHSIDAFQNCCPLPVRIQEIVVETPALTAERERSQESPELPAPALSTLRIKSENGEQAFLLMMRPEDTVGDVRTLLAQARSLRTDTRRATSTWGHFNTMHQSHCPNAGRTASGHPLP